MLASSEMQVLLLNIKRVLRTLNLVFVPPSIMLLIISKIVHYASRDENGGMHSERQVRRTRPKGIVGKLSSAGTTVRGRRPRDVNRAR